MSQAKRSFWDGNNDDDANGDNDENDDDSDDDEEDEEDELPSFSEDVSGETLIFSIRRLKR